MKLSQMTSELLEISRFGCDLLRLLKREGDNPDVDGVGPWQVRFFDGARITVSIEDADRLMHDIQERIASILSDYSTELVERMRKILHGADGHLEPEEARMVDDFAKWIDDMNGPPLGHQRMADGTVSLFTHGAWVVRTPVKAQAEKLKVQITEALSPLRDMRYNQVVKDIRGIIGE